MSINLVGELDDNLGKNKGCEIGGPSGEAFVKYCLDGRDKRVFVSKINVAVLCTGFCVANFVLCQYLTALVLESMIQGYSSNCQPLHEWRVV